MNCGFYFLAETDVVVMLGNKKNGLYYFYKRFLPADTDGMQDSEEIGCIVMNGNPFTRGHLSLITYAASCCHILHVFVVEEERSVFPFDVRIKLIKEGTAHLKNVFVHPSGPYMISATTFPSYFLKKGEEAARIQSELDVTLFASGIAPIFHITKRFVGTEPLDPVTAQYNQVMEKVLPNYGIELIKIPRVMEKEGRVISASLVRQLLNSSGVTEEVLGLVPSCTAYYLKHQWKR